MLEENVNNYQENHDTLVTFGDDGYTMRKDDPLTKEAIEKSKKMKKDTLSKFIKSGELSLFSGLNLSDKREDDEDFEEYKARRKTNKNLMKIYKQLGREKSIEMYPQGFKYAIKEAIDNENIKNSEPKFTATIDGEKIPVIIKNDDDDPNS